MYTILKKNWGKYTLSFFYKKIFSTNRHFTKTYREKWRVIGGGRGLALFEFYELRSVSRRKELRAVKGY